MTVRLGILGSTKGTVLQTLIDARTQQRLSATIECVISNRKNAYILERARMAGIKHYFIDPKGVPRAHYDQQLTSLLRNAQVDWVILIGYMRILSSGFINQWRHRILNIHPSLLPDFAGGMDQSVHEQVLAANKTVSGCTVHEVTEDVDGGPILMQKQCNIAADETVDSLKAKVQKLEGDCLMAIINQIAKGELCKRSNPSVL